MPLAPSPPSCGGGGRETAGEKGVAQARQARGGEAWQAHTRAHAAGVAFLPRRWRRTLSRTWRQLKPAGRQARTPRMPTPGGRRLRLGQAWPHGAGIITLAGDRHGSLAGLAGPSPTPGRKREDRHLEEKAPGFLASHGSLLPLPSPGRHPPPHLR